MPASLFMRVHVQGVLGPPALPSAHRAQLVFSSLRTLFMCNTLQLPAPAIKKTGFNISSVSIVKLFIFFIKIFG